MATRKVKIDTRPVADRYASGGQKIIEYSSRNGGGLISFRVLDDGTLAVDLTRHDDTVSIAVDDQCVKPATRTS